MRIHCLKLGWLARMGSSRDAPPVLDGSTTHHASKTVFAVSLQDKEHFRTL